MSKPKETFFFSDEYDQGAEWFSRHFCHCSEEKVVGEASTTTMYTPEATDRIREVLGTPKLAFVLRDPVKRAYSEYLFFVHKGRIPANVSFSEVVIQSQTEYSERILRMGRYAEFLSPFIEAFDRDRIKVVLHGDFRRNPEYVLRNLHRFLKVDTAFKPDLSTDHNVTRSPKYPMLYYWIRRCFHVVQDTVEVRFPEATEIARKTARKMLFSEEKPRMSEEVRAHLRDYYTDSTARLESWLGRDLSHWESN